MEKLLLSAIVSGINDIRQTEMHTAEPLELGHISLKLKFLPKNWKKIQIARY
jgi:hypothetical protein